jgi:hypothetical protein
VFPDTSQFVEGEKQLGRYTISIARYTGTQWSGTIPPLDVVTTNRRMFLRPQGRKKLEPASIPGNYIKKTLELEMSGQHGMVIGLKTGHMIYILIGVEHRAQLIDDIHKMKIKAKVHFDPKIVEADIQRLITFINQL